MATLNPSARASTRPRSMHSRARSRVSAILRGLPPRSLRPRPSRDNWRRARRPSASHARPTSRRTSSPARDSAAEDPRAVPRGGDCPDEGTRNCTRRPRPGPVRARRACRRLRPASAGPPGGRPSGRRGSDSHLILHDEGAVEPAHVLPAHLRGLADRVDRLRLARGARAVAFDDLVAALAVDLVSLDMDREELDFVIGEAIMRLERGQVALVDARHLGLEPDEEPRRRDVERLMGHLEAPRGEAASRRELLLGLHLGPRDTARLREADQQVDVLGAGLFLDDVLEQEVPRVRIRALAVYGGAPARELRDVLVMLRRPGAELGTRELTLHPLLREGVQAAVAGADGTLELCAELTLAHGLLLARGRAVEEPNGI